MAQAIELLFYRGLLANLPVLAEGQPAYTTDTKQFYIGTSAGNQLVSGSAGNQIQAIVDFGKLLPNEDTTGRATVVATWVTAQSFLMAMVVEGQDHTDDEIAAEQITATVGNIQPGVGFDVVVSAPNGASGKFLVNVRG